MSFSYRIVIELRKKTHAKDLTPWSDTIAFARELEKMVLDRSPALQRWNHLRDGPIRYSSMSPFVWNPSSRLYAVSALQGQQLDEAMDIEVLSQKMDDIHRANEMVELGLLPKGMDPDYLDDEYCNLVEAYAVKLLGWSQDRYEKIKDKR